VIPSSIQEQGLVAVHELDNVLDAPLGDPLRGEPKHLAFQGHGHEGAHRPGAAEILVGLGHEGLDPIRHSAKCIEIALRKLPDPTNVLEVVEKEEIAGVR
jgi:hypothetical protein